MTAEGVFSKWFYLVNKIHHKHTLPLNTIKDRPGDRGRWERIGRLTSDRIRNAGEGERGLVLAPEAPG